MTAAHLLLLLLPGLAASPTDDASALIARLGASKYAVREEAAVALEKLGPEAVPALREALESRDPEVRTRAGLLLAKIDSDLMTRPTQVELDFQDRPLD